MSNNSMDSKKEKEVAKKKRFKVPHVYVLLLIIIFICAALSYIIPAGSYDMKTIETNGIEREVVDPNTFKYVESSHVGLMQFLSAVPRGMQEVAQIIFFIFIVGGSFGVVQATGAIEAGLGVLAKNAKGKEQLIIPIVMLAFGFCGSVAGMAEETLPFIPIFVSLFVAMGYDSITGTAVVLCGAGAGFAGAFMNPFTIGVAQGIAGLPLFSAIGFRLCIFVTMMILTVTYVMRYAHKIKKNPELSSMHSIDIKREDNLDLENLHEFGSREKSILIVFFCSIVLLVYGVLKWGWYMDEIAALFFGMSMIAAIIGRLSLNEFAMKLGAGMADVAAGALVVGFARGILVVLTDGNILHTILNVAAAGLSAFPPVFSAIGEYVFQCLLNFLVPSGSGQAAVSIPILAPLGDLVGVTRQTTCIAFQLGDGISNIFTPTSGYFMAGLALAKISWDKWAKWILPLIGLQYLLGAIAVVIAQSMELGPF